MYQVGDRVVYGIHGVCRVVSIEERIVDRKKVIYLVLEPLGQGGSRYLVPTHNEAAMAKLRGMLTPEELKGMLDSGRDDHAAWIGVENRRKQTYRELLSAGLLEPIIPMIRTLYLHKQTQFVAGKKVHLCDDNFLRDAERLVAGELAIGMDISLQEALAYLRDQLNR